MKSKSQFHYVILIVGIFLVFITSILLITNWVVAENIEEQIETKINQAQYFIESHIKQFIESKIDICKTTAKNDFLISAIENKDSLALDSIIQKIYNIEDNDYLLVTDSESQILIRRNLTNGAKDYVYLLPGVFEFLNNISGTNQNFKISYLINSDKYYLICSVPIVRDNNVLGTLSKGYNLDSFWQMNKFVDFDLTILDRQSVLYSTLELQPVSFERFFNKHIPIFDAVLATSRASDIINTTLDEKEIFTKIMPIGFGTPVYALISVPKSDEYEFLNTLLAYLIYLFIFFSLLILIIFFVILKRKAKQVENLGSQKKNDKDDRDSESDLIEEIAGAVLVTNIICSDSKSDNSLQDIFDNYQQIQTELVELYDGKVENITNNQMIASFAGMVESIDKSMQCAQAIMKLINKESKSTTCQISIGLNCGSLSYGPDEKNEIFGNTLEIAESIAQVAKPGQILIQEDWLSKIDSDITNLESKVWKLKNDKEKVKLVNIVNYKNY